MFNGEVEKREEVEAWMPWMKKYFQIYSYSNSLKARMDIYNLPRKADIWWQDIKRVKNIREKYVTWRTFKKYFKIIFFLEQYYEERDKEFQDLKIGSMSMKELSINLSQWSRN